MDLLNNKAKTYPKAEQLGPPDWLTLAKRAITAFKFYDSAVDFVKEGLDICPLGSKLVAKFKSLAPKLAHFNNEMLTKTGQMVGSNYSVTETLLTEDLQVDNTPVGNNPTHLNRGIVQSNLNVAGIHGYLDNAILRSFEMMPKLICLKASFSIPLA